MDISKIDKNFTSNKITEKNIDWYNACDEKFTLLGGFYSKDENRFRRVPKNIADIVSDGVAHLATHTSGIRLRFSTNSKFIAIKCELDKIWPFSHMPLTGQCSFGLTVNGISSKPLMVEHSDYEKSTENSTFFENICYLNGENSDIELYFPLYNGVKNLFIGLSNNSQIKNHSKTYSYDKPVVFYGSSITQGGCASKPDNQYSAILSKKLNFDFINLGFSGSAKGEKEIIEYSAKLNPLLFVCDYDHNAPTPEYLDETHFSVYENFRNIQKDTPIIFLSKPDFHDLSVELNTKRREIVYSTYKKALDLGDKNVYFIDGETLFTYEDWDYCTVDGCHPNDLGFYRMAMGILPILKDILSKI